MICRKATVALPDANFLSPWCQSPSFRAQNRGFCALFAFGTPIFGHFEHKIGVFVRFCPSEPLFSGISSTKSGFLCAFCLRNPHFRAFRAQNRGFCALLPASFFPMAPSASSKPHSAEKRTPVWLAIWRTWAGFANSQLRRAAFRCTYSYICTQPRYCRLELLLRQTQFCRPICTVCLRHLRISAG